MGLIKATFRFVKGVYEDVSTAVQRVVMDIKRLILSGNEEFQKMQQKMSDQLKELIIVRDSTTALETEIKNATKNSNIGTQECIEALEEVIYELNQAIRRLEGLGVK